MIRILALALTLLGILFTASLAWADRRIALVVGNGAYTQAAPLTNPANDARAIAGALERLGFEVVSGFDMSNTELRNAIRRFADKLVGADVALFFYAGHGLQVAGENYLIPVDAAIRTETDLDFNAVKMDLVSRQMDRLAKVKIIILDACRDNPFEKELVRSMGRTRSGAVKQGLAEISTAGGTLIVFATDPGAVALDGVGKHSPFTTALLKHIETPGVEIGLMMRRVTRDVLEATSERQRPWTNISLAGELYLRPDGTPGRPSVPPPAAGVDERQLELALWQTVERGGQPKDYEEYLRKYPNGQFAGVARNRLEAALRQSCRQFDSRALSQALGREVIGAGRGRGGEGCVLEFGDSRGRDYLSINTKVTVSGSTVKWLEDFPCPAKFERRSIANLGQAALICSSTPPFENETNSRVLHLVVRQGDRAIWIRAAQRKSPDKPFEVIDLETAMRMMARQEIESH